MYVYNSVLILPYMLLMAVSQKAFVIASVNPDNLRYTFVDHVLIKCQNSDLVFIIKIFNFKSVHIYDCTRNKMKLNLEY